MHTLTERSARLIESRISRDNGAIILTDLGLTRQPREAFILEDPEKNYFLARGQKVYFSQCRRASKSPKLNPNPLLELRVSKDNGAILMADLG